jgi:hypothetical protein
MTVGHLLFSVATTGYILIAIQLEERDMIHAFGDQYRRYRQQVGMLFPMPRGKRADDNWVHSDRDPAGRTRHDPGIRRPITPLSPD